MCLDYPRIIQMISFVDAVLGDEVGVNALQVSEDYLNVCLCARGYKQAPDSSCFFPLLKVFRLF